MEQTKLEKMIKLLLLTIVAILFFECNSKLAEINYYIPENFEGNIAIIYYGTNTEKMIYNFTIPDHGLLKVPYKFYKGDYIQNYYQRNTNNVYDTLQVELPSSKLDTTKNRIYFSRILTFEKKGIEPVIVETFYVGRKKAVELVKDRFSFENKLEKIVFDKK
jgi:hypothetical protein